LRRFHDSTFGDIQIVVVGYINRRGKKHNKVMIGVTRLIAIQGIFAG